MQAHGVVDGLFTENRVLGSRRAQQVDEDPVRERIPACTEILGGSAGAEPRQLSCRRICRGSSEGRVPGRIATGLSLGWSYHCYSSRCGDSFVLAAAVAS